MKSARLKITLSRFEVHSPREPSLEQLVMNKIWVIRITAAPKNRKKHGQLRLVLYVKGISIHISFLMLVGFQLSHHLPLLSHGPESFSCDMDKPRIPLG